MTIKKQVKSFPKYQVHKASNRGFIWWKGKRHYLGVANSPESFEAYNQFVAEIAQSKGSYKPDLEAAAVSSDATVGTLMAIYLTKIQSEVTPKEFDNIKYSFRPLRKLHEHTPVDKFGPKALKQVRQAMIDDGLTRKVVNQRIGRVKRLFKYGVAEEMVSPSTLHALQAVDGLREGRSDAPDTEPVKPVADEHLELLIPYLSNVVAAMLKVQRLTGMRPGEVCRLRASDIDMSGDVWLFSPYSKGGHNAEFDPEDEKRFKRLSLSPRVHEYWYNHLMSLKVDVYKATTKYGTEHLQEDNMDDLLEELRLIESGKSDFFTVGQNGDKYRVGVGTTFKQAELKNYLLSRHDKTLLNGKKDIVKVLRGYIDRGQLNWTINERSSNLKDGTVKKQTISITVRQFASGNQEGRQAILPLQRSDTQGQTPANLPKPTVKRYVPPTRRMSGD